MDDGLTIEYCGERFACRPPCGIAIGRHAPIALDDNLALPPLLLRVRWIDGYWWLVHEGPALTVVVSGGSGLVRAVLHPADRIPLVLPAVTVTVRAGATVYEFVVRLHSPAFAPVGEARPGGGIALTAAQRAVLLSLAEPILRRGDGGISAIPSAAEAARRIGCSPRAFHRRLDQLCARLADAGVDGLRGSGGQIAIRRKARLVEYALAAGLVGLDDLDVLSGSAALAGGTR